MTSTEFDHWLTTDVRPPLVMGVLNVTPDSFSDAGQFARVDRAIARAREMVAQGADLIDIGGESTRPGSVPVPADEQCDRIIPVLDALIGQIEVVWSVDTRSAAVATAALDRGASLVNDVSAGQDDPDMLPLVARRRAAIVLMHMQGNPGTMQLSPSYADVVAEVRSYLGGRAQDALAAGIEPHRILLDPGIGFGKTVTHNLELLRRLGELAALHRPLVLGVSRKKFIGTITYEPEPRDRIMGSAAAVGWGVANGAAILRVHDVGPMRQVVRMVRAIQSAQGPDFMSR